MSACGFDRKVFFGSPANESHSARGAAQESNVSDLSELPLAETIAADDGAAGPRQRDRIVILGRRAAGKTVYLSVLYEKYWKSLDELTMKAVSGNVHSDLIRVAEGLRAGRWPAATLETQHCDLEVLYKRRKYYLVALDYAGELFRRAFVEDSTDTPETAPLVKHLDSAAAVMILMDPTIALGQDVDATIDDDFGMTQAVTRIRNWPGGADIPFVVVFTKADEHGHLIAQEGRTEDFIRKHFPALARTLQKLYWFQVSAVQVGTLPDGTKRPERDSSPWQVEKPLLYCLDQIDLRFELAKQEESRRRQLRFLAEHQDRMEKAARRTSRIVAAVVVSLIVVAACIIALVWVSKS